MARAKTIPTLDLSTELEAARKALQPALVKLKKHLSKMDDLTVLPMGAVADQLKQLRDIAKLMGDVVSPASELIGPAGKNIEEHFIQTLAVGEASGVQGLVARVQVTESPVPTPDNWDDIYKHVHKTKDFAILNRQLNREHIRELWDDKKQVPGVGVFHAKKVSVTKLRGK
jgi:hypothetical protein